MRNIFILIISVLFLSASSVEAQRGFRNPAFVASLSQPASGGGGGGGGGLLTTLLNETLEGTGYSVAGWTESLGGGTVDEDYTSTVLDGSQSLRILTADSASSYTYNSYTAGSERWIYFQLRPISTPNTSDIRIMEVWDNGFGTVAAIELTSGNAVKVQHGTTESSTAVTTLSDGTTYHFYFRYVAGSGANGVASVGFSTDGTRPTGGNNFTSTSTGTATANAERLAIGWIGFSGVGEFVLDKIQVGDENSEP